MLKRRIRRQGMVGLSLHYGLETLRGSSVLAFEGIDPAEVVVDPWALFSCRLAEEFVLGGIEVAEFLECLARQG